VTIEYILLLVAMVFFSLKVLVTAPVNAFEQSGPRLALRVEKHLITGSGFDKINNGRRNEWKPPAGE
jgi:hypothetical protein